MRAVALGLGADEALGVAASSGAGAMSVLTVVSSSSSDMPLTLHPSCCDGHSIVSLELKEMDHCQWLLLCWSSSRKRPRPSDQYGRQRPLEQQDAHAAHAPYAVEPC